MMTDSYIDFQIGKKLLASNSIERNNHKSSGKLSAGMLGKPLQWQILKILGVPTKDHDEYTLRKFWRGKQIEQWLISEIPGIVETNKFVEYRDCIGYIDAVVDTKEYNLDLGIIPHEIKSVTNAKFKRIEKQGADRSHKLQAGLYALATNKEHFAIDYVASDDLRVKTFIHETAEVKDEIDQIIKIFYETLKSGVVPVFQSVEKWQENEKYSDYPEFAKLTEEEIKIKLKK